MTINLPDDDTEYDLPDDTLLAVGFAAHAVMIQVDPDDPAVPAVQLQFEGFSPTDPSLDHVKVTVLMQFDTAHGVMHALTRSVGILGNLRRNQETPDA